jgi:hypothetical protein
MDLSAKKQILATVLIGALTIMAVLSFAVPSAYASSHESVTYYFNPALCYYTGSCDGLPAVAVSCTGVGTLSLTPPSIGPAIVYVGGPCPDSIMSTVYGGVSFTVTSVTYSLFVSCETQSEGEFFDVGVTGPIGIVSATPIQDCSVGGTQNIVVTITPGPGKQLSNGESLISTVGFGELPQSTCFTCADNFSGTVTISGFIPSVIPEFPFGLIILLGVALPVMFVLRARYTGNLRSQRLPNS